MNKINNKCINFLLIFFLFFSLLSFFYFNSIKNENFLLPLDTLYEYDSVFEKENYKSFNPLTSDILLQFIPYRAINTFNDGITFWNSYSLGGLPFFEDIQSRTLEISNLLASLLNISLNYFFLFSTFFLLLFSGISLYYFLRELKLSTISALTGSIVFVFSSPVIIWINYTLGTTFIWLPFLFLCIEKIYNNNRYFLPIFSIAISFLIFAGHPQAALISITFVSIYVIYKFFKWKKTNIKKIVSIFIFLFLGITLSSIQSIPSFNFIKQSEVYQTGRGAGQDNFFSIAKNQFSEINATTSLFFERLKNNGILLFSPDYFGNSIERNYSYPEKPLYNNYFEQASYTGLLSIIISIIICIIFITKRKLHFWIFGFFISFALYANLPFINLFSYLPFINKFNLGRLTFVFIFCVSVLVAVGINEIIKKINIKNKKLLNILLVFIALIFFFDLYIHSSFLVNKSKSNVNDLKNNEIINFLKNTDDRFIGITSEKGGIHTPIIPNQSMIYQINDLRGYFVMTPNRFSELSEKYLSRRGNYLLADDIFSNNFLNIYSVKYIICDNKVCKKYENDYNVIKEGENVKILENDNALPRAFISYNFKSYKKIDSVHKVLDNYDSKVEENILIEGNFEKTSEIKGIDEAEIIKNNSDEIKIVAKSQERGLLVITNNYYEGWSAKVNGKEANIFPVFGSIQGIFIEEGLNTVELSYKPKYFNISLIISLISLLLIILSFFCIKKKCTLIGR